MTLFILQVPNLPLSLENGSERPTYCLHHARFTEQQNLLSKGKWKYRRIVSSSYHWFPHTKNKHKENSKRTLSESIFKFSYVDIPLCGEKFSCFAILQCQWRLFPVMLNWLKLIQYSRRLCLTYQRKFPLISVSELCILDPTITISPFTHSIDWIDSK